MSVSPTAAVVRVFAIVVLYRATPADSRAFQSLQEAIRRLSSEHLYLKTLLYDNTPGGCDPGSLPEDVRYEAARQNGLADAYNRALAIALHEECNWLLILDQDTALPADFLSHMIRYATDLNSDERIGAIVPHMLDAGRRVAPVCIRYWGVSYLSSDFEGTSRREVHATNSATLFRVSALKQVGGYSPYFWLDYVDGYMFHQLYLHGMKVFVAKDVQVNHQLSLLHGGDLKPDRYHNILRAESAYWDLYGGRVQGLALTGRLLGRIWRQQMRGHDASIRQLTWNELKRRIVQSKRHRIDDWRREMEQQMLCSFDPGKYGDYCEKRPPISVCMAAFNGERYITAQLLSIQSQLAPGDEVIVVDDASTDGTRDCVRALGDDRIRLIEHSQNLGVARTFENAIREASGEILFLSDQDDLWVAKKIAVMLRAFQLFPAVEVAVSDAALIDENGALLGKSYYAQRGKFRSSVLANILRCSYLGCTMAFRSRIRAKILPLPTGVDVLHDLWIGAVNSLSGGKTLYLDHPLVLYRRHEGNATGNSRLAVARQIRMRWDLCRRLAALWILPPGSVRDNAAGLS